MTSTSGGAPRSPNVSYATSMPFAGTRCNVGTGVTLAKTLAPEVADRRVKELHARVVEVAPELS